MNYPAVDGVLFDLHGILAVRWYGLMYIFGMAAFYLLGSWRIRCGLAQWTRTDLADLLWAGALGVVIGGRLGSMALYHADRLLADPLSLLRIWEGGMSFHGGLAGVLIACWIHARRRGRYSSSRSCSLARLPRPCTSVPLATGVLAMRRPVRTR